MITNNFIIVVPVYNSQEYIEKCIESIFIQTYKNFKVVVIDDCSTDSTYRVLEELKQQHDFTLLRNSSRVGSALSNIIKGMKLLSKEDDIIVTVDGDDWLHNDCVLSYLNVVYQNKDIWMSYGQFVLASSSQHGHFCRAMMDTQKYRKSGIWLANHLRTFRRWVWDYIKDEDLRDEDGEYYRIGSDTAWLFPMIELCGNEHIRFVRDLLYVYNDFNPINDFKVNLDEQVRVLNTVRNKDVYKPIKLPEQTNNKLIGKLYED